MCMLMTMIMMTMMGQVIKRDAIRTPSPQFISHSMLIIMHDPIEKNAKFSIINYTFCSVNLQNSNWNPHRKYPSTPLPSPSPSPQSLSTCPHSQSVASGSLGKYTTKKNFLSFQNSSNFSSSPSPPPSSLWWTAWLFSFNNHSFFPLLFFTLHSY